MHDALLARIEDARFNPPELRRLRSVISRPETPFADTTVKAASDVIARYLRDGERRARSEALRREFGDVLRRG